MSTLPGFVDVTVTIRQPGTAKDDGRQYGVRISILDRISFGLGDDDAVLKDCLVAASEQILHVARIDKSDNRKD